MPPFVQCALCGAHMRWSPMTTTARRSKARLHATMVCSHRGMQAMPAGCPLPWGKADVRCQSLDGARHHHNTEAMKARDHRNADAAATARDSHHWQWAPGVRPARPHMQSVPCGVRRRAVSKGQRHASP
jgi:hypothetical protein